MRLSKKNPLDGNPLPLPPSVLIHTASFIDEIKGRNSDIIRIVKIAALNTCPIVFSPISDEAVIQVLNEFEVDIATYYLHADQYIVKSKHLNAAFSAETDVELTKKFETNQGYTLNDSMLMGSGYFHYHLSKTAPRSIDIQRLLDILQIYHIKNGIFKTYPIMK